MTTIITFSFSNTYTENLTTFLYINWQVFTYSHLHSPLILLDDTRKNYNSLLVHDGSS